MNFTLSNGQVYNLIIKECTEIKILKIYLDYFSRLFFLNLYIPVEKWQVCLTEIPDSIVMLKMSYYEGNSREGGMPNNVKTYVKRIFRVAFDIFLQYPLD